MKQESKAFDPKAAQKKWYAFWEKEGFFSPDPKALGAPFCVTMPPPNVTGVLHMGHALVCTLQDILVRYKRMKGHKTLWVPGTDHAGIATQTVVERELLAKEGKKRADYAREEFLSHVWAWKEQSEKTILSQLKELGCSCDWNRLAFTMDPVRSKALRRAFKTLYDKGLIYQGDYLVNWDPKAETALSDDEVEHEEIQSFLWYIRYNVSQGGHILIATTRPETLLGDTAIAVHPKDPRYQSLIGKTAILPLTNREIPIVADPFVDPEFGTGAVKITPAHDFNDFEMGQRLGLEMINIMTPDGKILEGAYQGLSMQEAREAVLRDLKEHLVKKEPHTLRIGISYRSKAIIEPYLSKQWFVKMSAMKETLIQVVKEKKVRLIPPHWEATYFHWIENLRDWCISRQLWWGHRIPIWTQGDKVLCCEEESGPEGAGWVQDPDVLDTWFSSALWPFSTLGWPEKTADFREFFPNSTLITGHDILFFWVARMIMMSEALLESVPFPETFLHGLIYGKSYWKESEGGIQYVKGPEKKEYDLGAPLPKGIFSKWEKMSKSKGNVIDPLAIIEEYGADALRFALASRGAHARQIDMDLRRFEECKNFANKIYNGARFVFMHLEDFDPSLFATKSDFLIEDAWIFSRLSRTLEEVEKAYASYNFDRAAQRSYDFFWNDFCSLYLEIAKPILFGKMGTQEERKAKQKHLALLLLASVRMMHPIAPFLTEEIFSQIKTQLQGAPLDAEEAWTREALLALQSCACIVAPYPSIQRLDEEAEVSFTFYLELVRETRNIRAEMQIPPGEKSEVYIEGALSPEQKKEAKRLLLSITPTAKVHFVSSLPEGFGAKASFQNMSLMIPLSEALKAKEKKRLEKEKTKLEGQLTSLEARLQSAEFREKAPAAIVKQQEASLAQAKEHLQETRAKIEALEA